MTTGDLVRNEIFAKVANAHPDKIEAIDLVSWQPFYKKFAEGERSLFDDYFFPYGLVLNPNVKKSEVYSGLREKWKDIKDPATIVGQLAEYQDAFLDLSRGTNTQGHTASVASSFRCLFESKAPSSTFPFLMQLSNAAKIKSVPDEYCVGVLNSIESFLVRRAICGHEPTGLHAVFKKLWSECVGEVTSQKVVAEIRKHKTVVWPSDQDVEEAVKSRPLYGSAITKYLLLEWNRSLGGDIPSIVPWIEHVLPEKATVDWLALFSIEQHASLKDVLANLLPLSEEMNRNLSNGPYPDKRAKYQADSVFKAARQFAEDFADWTPDKLLDRGQKLANWVLTRWPNPS